MPDLQPVPIKALSYEVLAEGPGVAREKKFSPIGQAV